MVVRELIGRPGTSRQLDRRMPAPADLSDDIVTVGSEVTLSGVLESVVDGLLVRGRVEAPARVACVRCLTERDELIGAEVIELYSKPDGTAEEAVEQGYEIIDDAIDLDTLLRDALAAAAPAHPLCRPDCAGLCATCGADLNIAPCDGHPEQSDSRWSALAGLDVRPNASEPVGGDPRARASASEPVGGDPRARASASEPVGGDPSEDVHHQMRK